MTKVIQISFSNKYNFIISWHFV